MDNNDVKEMIAQLKLAVNHGEVVSNRDMIIVMLWERVEMLAAEVARLGRG